MPKGLDPVQGLSPSLQLEGSTEIVRRIIKIKFTAPIFVNKILPLIRLYALGPSTVEAYN